MAAGTALVCSDLDAFREVAGDAALYAPPGNPQVLAARLGSALRDEAATEARRERGGERAARFDWRRLARDVESVYEEAAGR